MLVFMQPSDWSKTPVPEMRTDVWDVSAAVEDRIVGKVVCIERTTACSEMFKLVMRCK